MQSCRSPHHQITLQHDPLSLHPCTRLFPIQSVESHNCKATSCCYAALHQPHVRRKVICSKGTPLATPSRTTKQTAGMPANLCPLSMVTCAHLHSLPATTFLHAHRYFAAAAATTGAAATCAASGVAPPGSVSSLMNCPLYRGRASASFLRAAYRTLDVNLRCAFFSRKRASAALRDSLLAERAPSGNVAGTCSLSYAQLLGVSAVSNPLACRARTQNLWSDTASKSVIAKCGKHERHRCTCAARDATAQIKTCAQVGNGTSHGQQQPAGRAPLARLPWHLSLSWAFP